MKKLMLVAVAVLLVVGLIAGCSGGGGSDSPKNYFKGRWQAQGFNAIITFTDTTATVSGAASGSSTYTYQGEYPDFVLTFTANGKKSAANVHFFSENQFRGCSGADCVVFNKI